MAASATMIILLITSQLCEMKNLLEMLFTSFVNIFVYRNIVFDFILPIISN